MNSPLQPLSNYLKPNPKPSDFPSLFSLSNPLLSLPYDVLSTCWAIAMTPEPGNRKDLRQSRFDHDGEGESPSNF